MFYIIFFAIFLLLEIEGKPPSKIVGGTNARINNYPFVVSIQYWEQHFCGGALISRRHVLTAAHCLSSTDEETKVLILWDKDAFTIATGSSNSKRHNHLYQVHKINVHPLYTGKPPLVLHDIGIITMAEEAILDATTQTIGLPTDYCWAGQHATVLGWGYLRDKGGETSEWLQKAPVTTLSNAECMKRVPYPIGQNHLCGFYKKGTGFCDGDSGGPLVLNGKVVAVVSMGYFCGGGLPDMYTRTEAYKGWITQVMRGT